jgi:hypothetical protein
VDGEDDPIKAYFDTIECVKPGDSDEVTIELENVGCVDGMLDLMITITESDENIAVEPELNAGDLEDDTMDNMDGELAANLEMRITADLDGDTVFETLVAEGAVSVIEAINYVYGALDAGGLIELKIEWWVDAGVGNMIMTDTLEFDIEFSLDQAMEACLTVVNIDQPDVIQECETVDISVDVRNTGGAPGECDLNVTVTSPEGQVASAVVPTGTINSLETKSVLVFDDLHIPVSDPPLAVPYTVTVSVIDCCTAEEVLCTIEVVAPPELHVVDMIQPADAYWCDELIVEVGVHNAGGKAGACELTVMVLDAILSTPTVPVLVGPPVVVPVPTTAPCDTTWVPVNLGHVDEMSWPELILVVAYACADNPMEPYMCMPPINVGPPPPVGNVGSTWTYDVTYATATPEVTTQTYTMMARGLGDPLPAGTCVAPPSGEGPYYHMSLNTNATCVCAACTASDSPLRGALGINMIILGSDVWGKESNSTEQYSLMPSCGLPPPMLLASTAEIAYTEYTAVVGSIGYPYAVGDSWTSRLTMDADAGAMGCISLLMPMADTIVTSTVVAVGVANPGGGPAAQVDCVHIAESAVAQVDDDGDGLYSEDPIDGVDNDGDTLVDEDPVETAPACVTDIYWSPTVKGMVEQITLCTYDFPETWLLQAYTLAP